MISGNALIYTYKYMKNADFSQISSFWKQKFFIHGKIIYSMHYIPENTFLMMFYKLKQRIN